MRTGQLQSIPMALSEYLGFSWFPLAALTRFFLQISHDSTSCFISANIPGQKMHSLALIRHASVPRCDECILFFMLSLGLTGTTTCSPLKMRPFCTVSSSLWLKYGRARLGTDDLSSGQP